MNYEAPISGNVWKVLVKDGDHVQIGDVLIIMESMKMEIPIEATAEGTVKKVIASETDFVQESDIVIEMED
ncbi:acetyl-CoA carboxylase biotin carboxyl carrier protein subunit [Bacillus sp. SM2101]|uniref:acetyl-CoA carboxylase biotin carboxyl carrier protein subunit n=1 Tax=Bacillus sp. SM2101 TaxID=2805366 RepID=UPI001BDEE4F3